MSDTREREDHGPRAVAAFKALQVLVLDRRTREYLKAHDPQALKQACEALAGLELQYRVPSLTHDGNENDVCWYCFAILGEPEGVCRDCTAHGRQLPYEVWKDLPK